MNRSLISSSMVMTLCPRCLSFYRERPNEYLIRRLTPWNGPKSCCTKCDRLGYDYEIVEKAR